MSDALSKQIATKINELCEPFGLDGYHVEDVLSVALECLDLLRQAEAQRDAVAETSSAEIDRLTAENEHLKAFISDRIHDATREAMLVEVNYGCKGRDGVIGGAG